MSKISNNASFFSFGVEDSFISRCRGGLRYRNLPPTLHDLLVGGSVIDAYWAALGTERDSWVFSFKDSSGKSSLAWGQAISETLKNVLGTLTPSPHLRVFLGPGGYDSSRTDSFIAWDSTFIRWANLPKAVEQCVQQWLTPCGWRVGAPRIVTWGLDGAFFAMSEYGKVVYEKEPSRPTGQTWPIFAETIEEWEAEKRFRWDELAYISLDPTTKDQFIAIRNDGTWAGSIDDSNENALEDFALNFFARQNPYSEPKNKQRRSQQTNGHTPSGAAKSEPAETVPHPVSQALYEGWAKETATLFASASAATSTTRPRAPKKLQIRNQFSSATLPTPSANPRRLSSFPYLPPALATCVSQHCVAIKADAEGIRACKHDVERLLRASGLYSKEWLRQERIRWHPDRFGRLCEEEWRDKGKRLAEEMFKIVGVLIGELEKGEANGVP